MLIGLFGDFRNRHQRVPVTQLIASAHQQAKLCFVHIISGRPAMSSQGSALSHLRSLLLVPKTWAYDLGESVEEAAGQAGLGCWS